MDIESKRKSDHCSAGHRWAPQSCPLIRRHL